MAPAVAVARASAAAGLAWRVRRPPASAPANIAATAAMRRRLADPGPPAKWASAARAVSVSVSTVVVRSGTAMRRATAFWPPSATASSTITAYRCAPATGSPAPSAATNAAASRTTSAAIPVRASAPRWWAMRRPSAPPSAAPARNAAIAVSDAVTDSPGAPASANPSSTTLPVMFATKTCPSAM